MEGHVGFARHLPGCPPIFEFTKFHFRLKKVFHLNFSIVVRLTHNITFLHFLYC